MTLQWSSEFALQNLQVNAMALDYDGTTLLFVGRDFLGINRLFDAKETIEKYPCNRNEKYNTSTVEWNPTVHCRQQFAVTCNERVMLASISESDISGVNYLKHHSRQVTHLNWHRIEPNVLASASADSTALVWDTRDPRRPVITFTSAAGVCTVRWNKLSSFLLATAHDNDLRIWDQRKGSVPVQYIAAHNNKIYGIDWSETHEYQLASCSQDCTVKLFDVTNPKRAESIMPTTGPAWKVSYAPWGEGLMTVVIPSPTEESTLQLWNTSSHSGPVHSFVGPLDVIVEALWRQEGGDYQLLTWSRDQCLRAWRIEPFLQRLCGCPDSEPRGRTDTDSVDLGLRSGNTEAITSIPSDSPRTSLSELSPLVEPTTGFSVEPFNMEDELKYITSWNLSSATCETSDVEKRSCVIGISLNRYKFSVLVIFPPSYPYNAAPSFQISDSAAVDSLLKAKLLKVLKQAAQQRVRKNRTCLENCMSQLVACLEGSSGPLGDDGTSTPSRVALGSSPARLADPASVYSSFHDDYIPYPKFSGARFCSVGVLVVFARPSRLVPKHDQVTPRSLSAATSHSFGASYGGSYPRFTSSSSQDPTEGDFSFFLSERQNLRVRGNRSSKVQRPISIYSVSKLFFIHKHLAEKYRLDAQDVKESSVSNTAVAATAVDRPDLVQVWNLASLATAHDQQNGLSWNQHPFSAALINQMIQHYAKISDIQTAAMLSCVFQRPRPSKALSARPSMGNPYHTIHPTDTTLAGWPAPNLKHHRSNSWSQLLEESGTSSENLEVSYDLKIQLWPRVEIFEELKRRYADVLHMWGLVERRTAIIKLLLEPAEPHSGVEFVLKCQNCKRSVIGSAYCSVCLRFALRCVICRVLVRGASNVCLTCGHGGHAYHMREWFTAEKVCPSGCGCCCTFNTRHAFD